MKLKVNVEYYGRYAMWYLATRVNGEGMQYLGEDLEELEEVIRDDRPDLKDEPLEFVMEGKYEHLDPDRVIRLVRMRGKLFDFENEDFGLLMRAIYPSMKTCTKCGGEDLWIYKLTYTPNWWWCSDCGAAFDEWQEYRGQLKELERNGTLKRIEEENIKCPLL